MLYLIIALDYFSLHHAGMSAIIGKNLKGRGYGEAGVPQKP
jgi:hypothetical protein